MRAPRRRREAATQTSGERRREPPCGLQTAGKTPDVSIPLGSAYSRSTRSCQPPRFAASPRVSSSRHSCANAGPPTAPSRLAAAQGGSFGRPPARGLPLAVGPTPSADVAHTRPLRLCLHVRVVSRVLSYQHTHLLRNCWSHMLASGPNYVSRTLTTLYRINSLARARVSRASPAQVCRQTVRLRWTSQAPSPLQADQSPPDEIASSHSVVQHHRRR